MNWFTKLFHHEGFTKAEVIRFLALRTVGNFLFLLALTGIVTTFGDAAFQEVIFRYNLLRGVHYVVADAQATSSAAPKTEEGESHFNLQAKDENIVAIAPTDTSFSVVIPKINANATIYPNVDPANYDQYMAVLQKGVAHAAGSVFPGMDGDVYLFAHSTDYWWNVSRYNAVFYLLKELNPGDEIDIFFQGRRYIYIVNDTKIVAPDDVSYLQNNVGGEPRLTLQTCWPPGTSLRRLLVFAKPKATVALNSSKVVSLQ